MKPSLNSTQKRNSEAKASVTSIVTNLLLAVVKLICGIFGAAPALISDAIHSAADLVSTVVVLIGIRLSSKPPDRKHPFGHERFESLAAILLSAILLFTGIGIGYGGIADMITGAYRTAEPPLAVAVFAAFVSVSAKLILSLYMRAVSKKTLSTALRADAFHQLSDALASLGALLGIVASILGFPIFDPLASVFISLFLFRAAVSIFTEAARGLIDRSADGETEALLIAAAEASGHITVHWIRTRILGSRIDVEIELYLKEDTPLLSCAYAAEEVRRQILAADPRVMHCSVLTAPLEQTQDSERMRERNSCLAPADS